ncbi:MAG: hypothetical protein IKX74_04540 [Erysipelotrichaceae bacterium]|nr:hypothetical protein [Erysipelotrichaceae bacterium]
MKQPVYLAGDTVIINLSRKSYKSVDELVAGESFNAFLQRYFKDLAVRDIRIYRWLTNGRPLEETVPSLIELIRQLLVQGEEITEVQMSQLDRMKSLYIAEDCYSYWRSKKRFTLLSGNRADAMMSSFIDYDEKYNSLIRQLYRTCREKLLGRGDKIYRQTSSGSNASCLLMKYRIRLPGAYASLRNVPFIARVMLRTPIMMDFENADKHCDMASLDENPLDSFSLDIRDFFCLPLKVGDLLCLTCFHKDYLAQAICLVNMFELAEETDCLSRTPDLICLFGLTGEGARSGFYHDADNGIHLAALSSGNCDGSFSVIKDAILTLHNLAQLDRGRLPVRGSMMEIYFRDDTRKSLLLIGDMGAGKSETIEALMELSNELRTDRSVRRVEVVFDDMGTLRIADSRIVARGSETGGLERLDDLWQNVYRDIEKGVFINLQKQDPKVILPISSHEMINCDHVIDMVLYANNYAERIGIERFEHYGQFRDCLIEGRHMRKDPEGRNELASVFLANPCIPEERQPQCRQIMDEIFGKLFENEVYAGQLFTNLASGNQENLRESARCLWQLLGQLPS